MIGRQRRRRDSPHERLGAHPVLNQIRDRDHQQLVPLRELRQLRHPRHRAVVVHDFADDAGRIEAGDAREIDGRLGLPGAHEHAAVARLERKHVAGPREVGGPGRGIDRRQHRGRAIARRDAGARDALGFDRDAERGLEARGVLRRPSAAGRARRSRSSVIGMQIRPRPCFAMKLMASGVIFSAAIVRSPSFSRSSSSTTMIILPSRIASIASSIGAKTDLRLRPPRFLVVMVYPGCCSGAGPAPCAARARAPRTSPEYRTRGSRRRPTARRGTACAAR